MKQSDSTEMDRLFRRYAGRKGETPLTALGKDGVTGSAANPGLHLDADEMNAYAEDVMPAAMRSRYFAHLADCDSCRKLVTELTLVASRTEEAQLRAAATEVKSSKSWRAVVSAIFSPTALRYGLPAMALLAIVIVAILAMRTQRREASVAMNREEAEYSAPPSGATSNSAADPAAVIENGQDRSNSNIGPGEPKTTPPQRGMVAEETPARDAQQERDQAEVSSDTIAKSGPPQPGDLKDRARDNPAAGKRPEETASAPAPNSPVLAAPPPEPQNRAKLEEQKKNKGSVNDGEDNRSSGNTGGAMVEQTTADETRQDGGRAATARSAPAARTRRQAAKSATQLGAVSEKEDAGERRNVGGKQFQRQGRTWVDTAFAASRHTINVRRGSEQYRALVADEPGLRSIAEQLSGEVIVVWKSRAYRFH